MKAKPFKLRKVQPSLVSLVLGSSMGLAILAYLAAPNPQATSQAASTANRAESQSGAVSYRIDPDHLLARDICEFADERPVRATPVRRSQPQAAEPKPASIAPTPQKIVEVSPALRLKLVGVVMSSTAPVATLENAETGETYIASPGELVGGARLTKVSDNTATLQTSQGIQILKVWED